jgi:hypothetical protein
METKQVESLHGPVEHGRNAQGALLSIRLGDELAPQGARAVSPLLLQSADRRPFLVR